MTSTTKLLPSLSGKLGIIELNNPKIFHSIDLEMVHSFREILSVWHQTSSLRAILLRSGPAKRPAFCAGGDVRAVYDHGLDESEIHGKGMPGVYTSEMFRQEYIVNHMMATWDKPQISFWDGIVMGGGVGLSIHGKYRVSTENTIFAMPETAIGLFPDVGMMYWMPHLLPWSVASFLALSGARLRAPDLIHTGIATHFVPSERLDDLQKALIEATEAATDNADTDVLAPILMSFHEEPPKLDLVKTPILAHQSEIYEIFQEGDRVEDIVARLKSRDDPFSQDTLSNIEKMSPTSLKVTLEAMKRGKAMSTLEEDFKMEFRMSQAFMKEGSDFYKGIRAVLVDKDHNPQWSPATLEEVTDEMVESYFAPLGKNEWSTQSQFSNL